MNRLLSGLRSRALKSIELSRGLGAAEDYGDCNRGAGLGQFTMSVLSGTHNGIAHVASTPMMICKSLKPGLYQAPWAQEL